MQTREISYYLNVFKPTSAKTPQEYINMIEEPRRTLIESLDLLIQDTTGLKPFIQSGMLAYGPFHYKYASGREGDWFLIGLASQKNYISVYVCATSNGQYIAEKYKNELPKANIGKSCIRFKKIEDIDLEILKKILREGQNSNYSL